MGFVNKESGEWIRDLSVLRQLHRRQFVDPYHPPQMPSAGGIVNELAAAALFSAFAIDSYANKKNLSEAMFFAGTSLLFVRDTARQTAIYLKEYLNP